MHSTLKISGKANHLVAVVAAATRQLPLQDSNPLKPVSLMVPKLPLPCYAYL